MMGQGRGAKLLCVQFPRGAGHLSTSCSCVVHKNTSFNQGKQSSGGFNPSGKVIGESCRVRLAFVLRLEGLGMFRKERKREREEEEEIPAWHCMRWAWQILGSWLGNDWGR